MVCSGCVCSSHFAPRVPPPLPRGQQGAGGGAAEGTQPILHPGESTPEGTQPVFHPGESTPNGTQPVLHPAESTPEGAAGSAPVHGSDGRALGMPGFARSLLQLPQKSAPAGRWTPPGLLPSSPTAPSTGRHRGTKLLLEAFIYTGKTGTALLNGALPHGCRGGEDAPCHRHG